MTAEPAYRPDDLTDQTQPIPVFGRWFGSWWVSVGRRAYNARQLERLYDDQSQTWDAKLARMGVIEGYQRILRQVFPRDRDDLHVLDAGVGTGALSLALGHVATKPVSLHGIDLSSGMLAEAQKRLDAAGQGIALTQGDITDLPYQDGRFDVVMTAHTLEHLPVPQNAIRELARVLRPGGMLIACVTRRSPLGAYIQLKWHTHRVSPDAGRQWFRGHGLRSVRAIPLGPSGTLLDRLSVAYVAWKDGP